MLNRWRQTDEHHLYLSCHEIGHRRRATAIRHMDHVDPGHHFEQFAGDMDRRADAARSVADLAGIGLHIADELGNGLRRERWIYLHDKGVADDARDRSA